jgi:hypothetical protein
VTSRYAVAAAIVCATAALATGCHRDGCVGGDDGTCVPPSACSALRYACTDPPSPRVGRIGEGATRLPYAKARGADDDILMENDLVRVVLDAPAHPSGLAPTGGSIIDLAPKDSGDQINAIYQAAGLLPRDAVHYTSHRIESGDPTDMFVAVVFRGHLEADTRVTVVTRYELRPCEPGVRVRSDLYNGTPDPNTLYLADGLLWGDNSALPFVPGVGLGFRAPKLDLLDVASAWREWPFVAARTQATPDVSYAVVPCDRTQSAGFNDPTLTASGVPLTTTLPGDGIHFERFIIAMPGSAVAVPGSGLAPAVGEALRARAMLHGEVAPVTVTGRVVAGGTPISGRSGRAASLLFYEPGFGPDPDDPARRKPWSEAVPGSDGRFTVALPADRTYRVQPYAFGLPAAPPTSFVVGRDATVDLGDLTLTASARLRATVVTAPGQTVPDPATYAELVLIPVDQPGGTEVPSLYGLFPGCTPMLGPPHGGSPACNRAVRDNGVFDLLIPPGHYYVYATRGPFAALDRGEIAVAPGGESRLTLVVPSLPTLLPAGVVSGDFHVHGAASYDSSIPDEDRVFSFLAAGLDVVVATDHDVATSYAAANPTDRLTIIPGVEQTPNIPWFAVPGEDFPQTLGHFNFWPLEVRPDRPGNGVPWDELREPGQMMDDIDGLFAFAAVQGVRQLNHPFAGSKLGRDQGFPRAIGYDPRTAIAPGAGFAADLLLRTPGAPGGRRNLDWDVQEVMNGASLADWLRYRAFWFSLLSQGIVRAGTANSDSHSLALEQVGYPRNLVFCEPYPFAPAVPCTHDREALDPAKFDDDVRRGHMVGSNGPVLLVAIADGTNEFRPGLDPIRASPSAELVIKVSTAPWIPVTEVRVIVNGRIVNDKTGAEAGKPIDVSTHFGGNHLGTQALTMMDPIRLPLSALLKGVAGDAWLIVEAGLALPPADDVDGDGLPDLADADIPGRPDRVTDARFDFHAIAPGAWPAAFTNPFLLDVAGDGWKAPGLAP